MVSWTTFLQFLGLSFLLSLQESGSLKLRASVTTYPDYKPDTLVSYSGYHNKTPPTNLMSIGETYDKLTGFNYLSPDGRSGPSKHVFLGTPPSSAPEAILGEIQRLMNSAGMQACASNVNDPQCQIAKNQLENQMMNVFLTMDYSMPATFSKLIEWLKKLDLAEQQLSYLGATLTGSNNDGLTKRMALLGQAKTQIEATMDGAYQNVIDVIAQRKDLMNRERQRLTEMDMKAKPTIEAMSKKMIGINSKKAAIGLSKLFKDSGMSMENISKQAAKIGQQWSDGLNDLSINFDDWLNDITGTVSVMEQAVGAEASDAKSFSRLIRSALNVAAKQSALVATSQERDWRGNADRVFKEASADELALFQQDLGAIMAKLNSTFSDLGRTMRTNEFNTFPRMKSVRLKAASLLPKAQSDLKATMEEAISAASDLVHDRDLKAIYLSQNIDDISKLVADESLKAQAFRDLGLDAVAQLAAQSDNSVSAVNSSVSNNLNAIAADVSGALGGYGNTLTSMEAQGQRQAAVVAASAAAAAAGVLDQASTSSLQNADVLATATNAASLGNQLNQAQLQSVADTTQATINAHVAAINGALVDGHDAVSQIASAMAGNTQSMESSLTNTVARSASGTAGEVKTVASDVENRFQELSSDTQTNQQAYSASSTDAKAAVNSISDYASTVNAHVADLGSEISGLQSTLSEAVNRINAALPSQSSFLSSSISSVGSAYNRSLLTSLFQSTGNIQTVVSSLNHSLLNQVGSISSVIRAKLDDSSDELADLKMESAEVTGRVDRIANQIQAVSPIDLNERARVLLNALSSEAISDLMTALGDHREALDSRVNNLRSAVTEAVREKAEAAAQRIESMAGNLSQDLDVRKSQVVELGDQAASLLLNISGNVGQSKLDFDEFNHRVNGSQSILDQLSDQALYLVQSTQERVADMLANVLQRLSDRAEATANETLSLSDESRQKIDSSISTIERSPDTVTDFVTNGTSKLDAFQAVIDQQARRTHERTVEMLKSVGGTISDLQLTASKSILDGSLNLTDSEMAVFNVLLGLTDSLSATANRSDNVWSRSMADLDSHRTEVASQLARLSNKIKTNQAKLELLAAKKQLVTNNKLASFIDKLGSDLSGSETNLTAAKEFFKGALNGDGWTSNDKKAYSISGMLRNLSLRNQGRLQALLEQVVSGHVSFSDALSEAREIDLKQIQSTNDAVGFLVGSMMDYQLNLYRAFGDSNDRLTSTVGNLNSFIDSKSPEVLAHLDDVGNSSSYLISQVDDFNNRTSTALQVNTNQIAGLQTMIEQNRTAINVLIGDLKQQVDQVEGEMQTNQVDFESWVDSAISDERMKAARKAQLLRQTLNVTELTSSSFMEDEDPSQLNMEIQEMKQRIARRLRRIHMS